MAKKLDPAVQAIRKALHKANLTHAAKAADISIVQARKIRDGDTKDPRWSTIKALAEHLGVYLCAK